MLLGLWAALVGVALAVARLRLGRGPATLRDELLARGTALAAVSAGLWGFALAAALLRAPSTTFTIPLFAWFLSALPLCIPPLRRPDGSFRISSEAWVLASLGVALVSGLAMALFLLVRLLLLGPELV